MRTVKPNVLGLLTRPFEYRRQFHLGAAVLSFVPMGGEPALLAESTMWTFLSGELPEQALDAVIPKSHAEFLAVAHAHAPGGAPVQVLRVGIKLGAITKTLTVTGERFMLGDRPTEAKPFTTLPIDWAHAYGGHGFADNPAGMGAVKVETPAGRLEPIPNVLATTPGAGYRTPAGFAALDQMWPARAKLAGTYGDTWLKEDFPGFPRDIDWRFFNLAPADQQFSGMLRGDEDYAMENLHSEQPLIIGRLPGVAPRLFLRRKGTAALEEVPLNLTTVWFFPHALRLVMVHHGRACLREEDGADVEVALVGADRLGAPRPVAEFEDVLARRLDRATAALLAMRDDMLVPADLVVPDPALADTAAKMQPLNLALKRKRKKLERSHEKMRAMWSEAGFNPDEYVPPLPPEQPIPTIAELPGLMEGLVAEAKATQAGLQAAQEARQAAVPPFMQPALQQILDGRSMPAGPPPAIDQAAAFQEMRAQLVAARETAAQMEIPPAFQKHFDTEQMERAKKVEQIETLDKIMADPAFAGRPRQTASRQREAYLMSAHYQEPAARQPPERREALRRLIIGDPEAAREAYDFSGADLTGLDLSGRDLSGICLDAADLTGSVLQGANLSNAVLAHARMGGCVLDGANLTGANLGKSRLVGASLRGAHLREANLQGADLGSACLAGADLEKVNLREAKFATADFSGAHAPGLLVMQMALKNWHAPGIMLHKAQFLEVDLEGADFSNGSLFKVNFLGCYLDGANFAGASLQKAVFVKASTARRAQFAGADLTAANLREADLAGSEFSKVAAPGADFSGADLTGANLTRINATGARFVAAKFFRASLVHGNFFRADLSRADLRGADLTQANFQDGNLPRVIVDSESRTAGMVTTRMRYLPRYQPAEPA